MFLLADNSGDFEQWACISHVYWARFFDKVHKDIAQGELSVFEISLRATGVPASVRELLFDYATVTHVRNRKRHVVRPFHKAMSENTYNNHLAPMICGTNVDRMIQADLASATCTGSRVLELIRLSNPRNRAPPPAR